MKAELNNMKNDFKAIETNVLYIMHELNEVVVDNMHLNDNRHLDDVADKLKDVSDICKANRFEIDKILN